MKKVTLEIYSAHKSFGLTLSELENDSGGGFRVFGPKLYGQSTTVASKDLTSDDIDELISRLKSAKKFLNKKR